MKRDELRSKLLTLTKGQLFWIGKVIDYYSRPYQSRLCCDKLMTLGMLESFGDALRTHHAFSQEACSKDKFEYILEQTLLQNGVRAQLAGKGNPGHDITIGQIPVSLKSQANKEIREDVIWISKFHELGKGDWTDKPKQLEMLREQFFNHMKNYEKILTLRCLSRFPRWKYQLVEIPKALLLEARHGRLEMMVNSKQMPKPGYCHVFKDNTELFQLYFDGGTERKLQIKNLLVSKCIVHATWEFGAD
jgi:hypothetical protein